VVHDDGLPAHTGPAVYYALLDAVRGTNPALAAELHDERPKRLATTAVLDREGRPVVGRNPPAQFQVGLLDDRLTGAILGSLPVGTSLRIGHHSTVAVSEVAVEAMAGYADILKRASPDVAWSMRFVTPTTFRTGAGQGARRSRPLPVPDLVFMSLGKRWNHFAGSARLDLDLVEEAVYEHVEVAGFELRTAKHLTKADHPRVFETGFVGTVRFAARRADSLSEYQLRALSTLMIFATLVGVGDKTNVGMGLAELGERQARSARRRR
jgi:CRISPR-associated endoribonuclease Cas6